MTRRSFLIQKYESEATSASSGSASVYGSYLQYPLGSEGASAGLSVKIDDDTKLKADDLSQSPILSEPTFPGSLTPTVSYFESKILDYNELQLEWNLALASTLTITPQPTRVLIVYSDLGEPQTVAEGLLLVDTNSSTTLTHYVQPGKWAYYSMFLKYENTAGVVYYDRVATLSELMPYNYGCSEDMYRKIPEYYRSLDAELDSGNGGPLKRMVSLFGFEADRIRTSIDYLMSCKDPLLAHSSVLDILAKDLTVDIRSDELGASKLRNILHSVGLIRRSLGTPASIALIVQSATGSEASFGITFEDTPAIYIYAQRVNYLKDPNIIGGAAGSFEGGTPTTKQFSSEFDANGPAASSPSAIYEGGTPYSSLSPYDPFVDADELFQEEINEQYWQYAPDPASGGSLSYLKTIDNPIFVSSGDKLYFSMHGDFVENAQNEVVKVALYGVNPNTAASAGYSGTVDDELVVQSTTSTSIAGIRYWELEIPLLGAEVVNYIDVSFTIFVRSSANISRGFQKMLLEKLNGGKYFDGDSAEGGWVVNYTTGARTSDYRWYNSEDPNANTNGPAQQTYSVYNSNYKKTRSLADRYLPQILPVKQISSSAVVYSNNIDNITTPIWTLMWNRIKGINEPIVIENPGRGGGPF